jgi:hypothetical protein
MSEFQRNVLILIIIPFASGFSLSTRLDSGGAVASPSLPIKLMFAEFEEALCAATNIDNVLF